MPMSRTRKALRATTSKVVTARHDDEQPARNDRRPIRAPGVIASATAVNYFMGSGPGKRGAATRQGRCRPARKCRAEFGYENARPGIDRLSMPGRRLTLMRRHLR